MHLFGICCVSTARIDPVGVCVAIFHCCSTAPLQSQMRICVAGARSPPSRHRPEFALTSVVPITCHFCAPVQLQVHSCTSAPLAVPEEATSRQLPWTRSAYVPSVLSTADQYW